MPSEDPEEVGAIHPYSYFLLWFILKMEKETHNKIAEMIKNQRPSEKELSDLHRWLEKRDLLRGGGWEVRTNETKNM